MKEPKKTNTTKNGQRTRDALHQHQTPSDHMSNIKGNPRTNNLGRQNTQPAKN